MNGIKNSEVVYGNNGRPVRACRLNDGTRKVEVVETEKPRPRKRVKSEAPTIIICKATSATEPIDVEN